MTFLCRPATATDVDMIANFNAELVRETEHREIDRDTLRRGAHRGLELFPEVRYFIAEFEGKPVGQIMLTREWSDWRDGWLLWLQSVYVREEHRRKGVFRELLQYCLQSTYDSNDIAGLRLYVENDNAAAQDVYRRTQFSDAGYRVMEIVPLPELSPETNPAADLPDGSP